MVFVETRLWQGTKDAVLMVESEASRANEDEMLGAVSLRRHKEMQVAISANY